MTLTVLSAAGEGFESPGVSDFWQPLFGTEGAFAVTRPMVVMTLSVVLISVVLGQEATLDRLRNRGAEARASLASPS